MPHFRTFALTAVAALLAGAAAAQPPVATGEAEKAAPPKPPAVVEQPKSIEPGVYACFVVTPDGKRTPAPRKIHIANETNYTLFLDNDAVKEPGQYAFGPNGAIDWKTGPLANRAAGKYSPDLHSEPNQMMVQAWVTETAQVSCYMSEQPS